MKIRNIITTSALVVLLGLTGGSAFAGDAGDNDILVLDSTAVLGQTGGWAYQSDAGDNDILVLGSTAVSDSNEVASTYVEFDRWMQDHPASGEK